MSIVVDLSVRKFFSGSAVVQQLSKEALVAILDAFCQLHEEPELLATLAERRKDFPEDSVERLLSSGKFRLANCLAEFQVTPISGQGWRECLETLLACSEAALLTVDILDLYFVMEQVKDETSIRPLVERAIKLGRLLKAELYQSAQRNFEEGQERSRILRELQVRLNARPHRKLLPKRAGTVDHLDDCGHYYSDVSKLVIKLLEAQILNLSEQWVFNCFLELGTEYEVIERVRKGDLPELALTLCNHFAARGDLQRLLNLSAPARSESEKIPVRVPQATWQLALENALSNSSAAPYFSTVSEAASRAEITLDANYWRRVVKAQSERGQKPSFEALQNADDSELWKRHAMILLSHATSDNIPRILSELNTRELLTVSLAEHGVGQMLHNGAVSEALRIASLYQVSLKANDIRESVRNHKTCYDVPGDAHVNLIDGIRLADHTPVYSVPTWDFGGDLWWLDEETAAILLSIYLPSLRHYLFEGSAAVLETKNLEELHPKAKYFWRQVIRICTKMNSDSLWEIAVRSLADSKYNSALEFAELLLEQKPAEQEAVL